MLSTTCAMSPVDRRGSLPPDRRTGRGGAPFATATATAAAGRAGARGAVPDDPASKSSNDVPRIASSTLEANDEARSFNRWRSELDMGEPDNRQLKIRSTAFPCYRVGD